MEYSVKVQSANLYKHKVWMGLNAMVMKSLEYALPVTTLTEKKCDSLMRKLITTFVSRAGINQNVRKDVMYAPFECQGLGLKNPYLTQGISHICDILEHQ